MMKAKGEATMERAAANDSAKGWVVPFLATMFAMMALQMSSLGFSPLLPEIQKEFGMSFSQVGLFTGMYGLSALLLSVPGGMLAKRFGEKKVLSAGLLVVILGLILLSQAWNAQTAFAGRGLWLLGYRPAFVCVMTAIAVTAPLSLRSRSMGINGAISALAAAIGAPFGRAIGNSYGWRNGILAFTGMALLGVLVFYSFYRTRSKPEAPRVDPKPENTPSAAPVRVPKAKSIFRNPVVYAIALLEGMVGVGYFSSNFFIPPAVAAVFGSKNVNAAYILSTGFAVAVCGNIFFGYLMDRYNKWNVMGLMMIILIPASLCLNSRNLPVFWIATAIVLAVGLSAAQQCFSLAAELVTGREMGNVMGVVSLGPGIFGYIGPQMLGWLRDWTGGFTAGWYFLAAIATLSLIIIVYIKHYIKRRDAAA
jgi:predicted MFS family arabinose efflux permease